MVLVQHLPSHTVVIPNTVYMQKLYYLTISSATVSNLGKYTTSNIYHNILVQIQNSKLLRQTFAHTHLLVNVYED